VTRVRIEERDLKAALLHADRIRRDAYMRGAEDMRTGMTIEELAEELATSVQEVTVARLPVNREGRLRSARTLEFLVQEIMWWKGQLTTGERSEHGEATQ
jgi:hypothetical protein